MTQQQRTLLAIALSFGLTLLFSTFVTKPAAEAEALRLGAADAGAQPPSNGPAGETVAVTGGPAELALDAGVPVQEPGTAVPARLVDVDRPSMSLTFTSEGGGLTNAVLKGDRERIDRAPSIADGYRKLFGGTLPPPPHVDMAETPAGGAPQLAVSITGPAPVSPTQRYAVAEEAPGRVELVTTSSGFEVRKVFRWSTTAGTSATDPAGYLTGLEVSVKNLSSSPQGGELVVHATRAIEPGTEEVGSFFGGIGNESTVLCQLPEEIQRFRPDDDKPAHEAKGAVTYVGIDQTYFLTAVWPKDGPFEGRCQLSATTRVRSADLVVPLSVAPGQTVTKSFGVFMGPKALELLSAVGKSEQAGVVDLRLDRTVDFGWWAAICRVLLFFMRAFHDLSGNWGLAIILLTVMVKVILLPLTHKAMVSAEQMKKLSPRMEEIKKKYPEDRDKQNTEMMKLYQEAKVNPLGGCLPMLLQLPIWAALFTSLRTSYELYGEPFFGVWSDLTTKDPTYLLPLALGITMIVTQRLQPQMTMDKTQAFLMSWVMPIFFTAIMMNYPAGLSLYIFTNNLLSIAQQYGLRKYLARTSSAPARAGATR